MRKIYTFILLALFVFFAASAAKVITPQPESEGSSIYKMGWGNVVVKIDAQNGGRIVSFQVDDSTNTSPLKSFKTAWEILNQAADINQFGSTFWPSPQAPWSWPPLPVLDNNPYTVNIEGNTITMTSGLETKNSYRLRVTKKFQIIPADTSLVINYKITNENTTAQSWAPWEVTRVASMNPTTSGASNGITIFKKGEGSITKPLYENNPSRFTQNYGNYWYKYTDNIGTSGGEKMMCDGVGWLAHIPSSKNRILIKRFDNVPLDGVAPGESEIQIYTAQNNAYTELENQGAYQSIDPGASITYTVRWYGRPLPIKSNEVVTSVGERKISAFIDQVIARGDAVAAGIKNQKAETTTISVNSSLDVMTVETSLSSYNNVELVVYDLQGKVTLKHALLTPQQQISVNGLTTGSYLYQINAGTSSIAKGKFIIGR